MVLRFVSFKSRRQSSNFILFLAITCVVKKDAEECIWRRRGKSKISSVLINDNVQIAENV